VLNPGAILDEVDRMLDIGFVREIKYVIAKLPQSRHSLFFSATLTPSVLEVMRSFLTNPVTISVKTTDNLINKPDYVLVGNIPSNNIHKNILVNRCKKLPYVTFKHPDRTGIVFAYFIAKGSETIDRFMGSFSDSTRI